MITFLLLLVASDPASQPSSQPLMPDDSFNLLEGTRAGSLGFSVTPGLELFAQYAARVDMPTNAWFHRFDLTRGHVSLQTAWRGARARVVLEAVRSASEGALIGVATDSFVFRVREAFVGYTYDFSVARGLIDARAGVIPTLAVPVLEQAWGLRAVAPTMLESAGLLAPADLGTTVRYHFPRHFGSIAAGAFNGEGYTGRELNRGKNIDIAAELRPLAFLSAARPLTLFFAASFGSLGTAATRSDRLVAMLAWNDRWLAVGASFTYGIGLNLRSAQETYLVDAFARLELFEFWLLGVRFSWWQRAIDDPSDRLAIFLATMGARIVKPLEVFVAVSRSFPGAHFADALPGQDHWELRVVGRAVF